MTSLAAPPEQRRPAAQRWAWLIVLVSGVAAYLIVLRTLIATQNPLYVPSLLLLGSAVVPAPVLVYAASGRQGSPIGAGLIARGLDRRCTRSGTARRASSPTPWSAW